MTINYISECLRLINTSVAKRLNGQYYSKTLYELLNRVSAPPEKSADEIVADVTQKAGLVVKD